MEINKTTVTNAQLMVSKHMNPPSSHPSYINFILIEWLTYRNLWEMFTYE